MAIPCRPSNRKWQPRWEQLSGTAGGVWWAPTSMGEAAIKAALYLVVILALSVTFAIGKPYPPGETWKLIVRLHAFVLTALAVALQLAVYGQAEAAVNALSILVLIAAVTIFLSLLLGFTMSVVKGAQKDAAVAIHKMARKSLSAMPVNPLTANPMILQLTQHSPSTTITPVEVPSMPNPMLEGANIPTTPDPISPSKSTRVITAHRPSRVSLSPMPFTPSKQVDAPETRLAWTPIRKAKALSTIRMMKTEGSTPRAARPSVSIARGSGAHAAAAVSDTTTPVSRGSLLSAAGSPGTTPVSEGRRVPRDSFVARTAGLQQFRGNVGVSAHTSRPAARPSVIVTDKFRLLG
jgi:hypothetical protein